MPTARLLVTKAGITVFPFAIFGDHTPDPEPNNYILHSDFNSFPILAEGLATGQTVDSDGKLFSITHSLGYIPAAMAFIKFPDGYVAMAQSGQRGSGLSYQRRVYLQMDTTKLYLKAFKGASANYNIDIKWYIFNSDL